MQLFAEALALGSAAAIVGLGAARFALKWWLSVFEAEAGGRLPFWVNADVSLATMIYAAGLTVMGAAIVGVLPALKVTGRRVEDNFARPRLAGRTCDSAASGPW